MPVKVTVGQIINYKATELLGLRLNAGKNINDADEFFISYSTPGGNKGVFNSSLENNNKIVFCVFENELSKGIWSFRIRLRYGTNYKNGREFKINVT